MKLKRRKSPSLDARSGITPPADVQPTGYTPEMPDSLPEFPSLSSSTGFFRILGEGADTAREQDDSETRSGDQSTRNATTR